MHIYKHVSSKNCHRDPTFFNIARLSQHDLQCQKNKQNRVRHDDQTYTSIASEKEVCQTSMS